MDKQYRKPDQPEWVIVTFKEPTLWDRSEHETWMFNPRVRYILNKGQLESLKEQIETVSDLKNSRNYVQLQANKNLASASILVERHRDRGYGDYLFLTGPLNYVKHVSGGAASIDIYALTDRGKILDHNPIFKHKTPLAGPISYDNLHLYNYHWFIDSATEYDEEKDQLNVYDALYKQLGIDPAQVDPRFKRPSMQLVGQDYKDLDSLYYFIYLNKKVDLRRTGYYVVAPSTNSTLRSAPYQTWLTAIQSLASVRPVVVVGQPNSVRAPATDMAYGTFVRQLDQLGPNVVNLVGATPIRVASALISRAVCCFTLDSGLLYVAQSLRIPAVSLWGPISPWSRIGYDREYMDLAIWNRETCQHSACFAYSQFPMDKCPRGSSTRACEPLLTVTASQIVDKAKYVEEKIAVAAAAPKMSSPGVQ